MKFGLFGGLSALKTDSVGDRQIYAEFVDYVCEAEDLGYESLFLVEHHFTGLAQVSASLNLLSFLAAKTTRMRLGTAVVVLPWHNPVLLAEQVATLDMVSGGRFDFGIGRGYRENEFDGFGIPKEEADERFQEVLEILIKGLGSADRWSHQSKRWRFENVLIEPPPVQKPHPPFWVGAGSDRSIIQAANNGYKLLLDQIIDAKGIGHRINTYRNAIEAKGKTFDPFSIGLTRALHVALTAEERELAHVQRAQVMADIKRLSASQKVWSVGVPSGDEETRRITEESALLGPPEEIIGRLKELEAIGVQKVLMIDVGLSRDALGIFAREVMPEFPDLQPATAARAPLDQGGAAPQLAANEPS